MQDIKEAAISVGMFTARVTKDGTLDPKTPVEGYWLNKAEDGSRNSISLVQRIAYLEALEKESKPLGKATGRR